METAGYHKTKNAFKPACTGGYVPGEAVRNTSCGPADLCPDGTALQEGRGCNGDK